MAVPWKHKIPFGLIYLRIFIAVVIGVLAFNDWGFRDITIVILIGIGLLSDVFDGILARKWDISTDKLRIWDSNADQIF
ncbi:MAG: phosphatidylglycerophosphate synthase [Bacteroidia bacterium]|jgi:phosphatidylglycerophosphate synthase